MKEVVETPSVRLIIRNRLAAMTCAHERSCYLRPPKTCYLPLPPLLPLLPPPLPLPLRWDGAAMGVGVSRLPTSWNIPVPSVRIGMSSPCATNSQRTESSSALSIKYSGSSTTSSTHLQASTIAVCGRGQVRGETIECSCRCLALDAERRGGEDRQRTLSSIDITGAPFCTVIDSVRWTPATSTTGTPSPLNSPFACVQGSASGETSYTPPVGAYHLHSNSGCAKTCRRAL